MVRVIGRGRFLTSVIRETGTQTVGKYIGSRKTTVAEWVELRPIYEVCENEMGYNRGGRHREPWWRKTSPRAQLRDTIENILAAAIAR